MTVSTPQQQTADPVMAQALQDLEQSLAQALQLAVAHQQAGQLEEAETLYRTILQSQPNHPEANHSLGVLVVQAKQAEAGLPYFAAALEAKPEQQQYWSSYIDALIQADETQTAQQVLALGREHGLQGDDMDALAERLNEGTPRAAPSNGLAQSVKPARQAALKTPNAKEVNALVALYDKGRLTEAEVLARSLTMRFPVHGFGWKVLGIVLLLQGRDGEALVPTQKAVELLPQDAEVHSNLGNVLKAVGRLSEAEASYRLALKIKPNFAEAHGNLGNVLQDLGRLSEAEASYQRALEIRPENAVTQSNLGVLLQEQGRLAEAEVRYRQALERKPEDAVLHSNLGTLLRSLGRLKEAEASLRLALELKPSYAEAHSNLLFCMSQNEAVDAAALFAEHCRFGAQFEAPLRAQWPQHGNSREPERCLQVGFVSGDLRNHAVASFIEPVWAHLAAYASLSLHAYANHRTDDDVTQRLRGYVKHWHPVAGLSDAALAEKIRADGIDILFDLSNHTADNRLLSFARKSAPVQISWIGYHGTTGLSSMDYYLTDRFLLPPGQFDHQFTEKLVYLPAWAPFLPSAEAPPVNRLPALNNGYLTFGSFNRPSKISRPVIALWSQLLRAIPDARMVLGAMRKDGQYDTLIAWFAGEGIARERLDFHPHSNMQDYLALHHQVDVCLDTFPYAGGTTTFHALWMGVPTLTLAGSTVAGHIGAGILGHVGLDAFVAPDAAAFVQQGVSLAADFSSLANLRSGLRERFAQSALGQPEVIAAGLERALRTMWQRWCAGLPAESFAASVPDMTVFPPPQQPAAPAMAQALQDLEQSLAQALQLAVAHQQAGQLEEAETLYRGILQAQPNHPDANHGLGVLAVQANQAEAGLPHFAAALEARPEQQPYWLSYIDALIQADETQTAKQVLALGREHGLQGDDMDALARRLNEGPPRAAPSNGLAQSVKPARQAALKTPGAKEVNALVALYGKGRLTEAQVLARSLTTRFPGYGFGWKMFGTILLQQGRGGDALAPLQKAVELLQTDAEVHSTLGVLLKDLGRPSEAEMSYRRALKIKPNYVGAHNNLGLTLKAVGRLSEAEASYRQALKIKPDYTEAHSNLGLLLQDLGRLSEAEASYRQALKIKPDFAEAHGSLGNVLQDLGRLSEAEASYLRALKLTPTYAEAHNNLGSLLQAQGRLTEAEASFRRVLELKPDLAEAHSNLLFCLSQNETVDAVALFAEHCRFGAQYEAPLRAQWPQHGNAREPERCLQVGFVSGDLRGHAVASFIEPVWAHLSAYASLSLHAYANHPTDDAVTQRLRGYVQHWHPVAGLSDAALADKIRADGIDILIDLSGHTARHRLMSFARKPAPVQVSWIGYPGTTGLSSMDYYLSDRFFLPPGQFDHQFTEKLVYLPATAPFLSSAEAPPVNALPALSNGYLTFGSFNRPSKISRAVIALWSQLLRALPDARMLLGAMPQDGQYDTLIAWFAEEGIARERLDFHPRSNMQAYLALHHQVDVCLDAFPYNGSTTSLHALWMGVPTLTLAGSTVAGRAGAWVLGHVGLDALVAQDAAAFVQQGLSLATDNFSTLANLRSGLRERFAQSAPGQPALIAAGLERALRTMWQRWCAGLPTESFEITLADMTISPPPPQAADPAMEQALQDLHQSLAQALQLAVAHQQAGQLEEAETLYRGILQAQPNHPEANHGLGVLAVQAEQAGAGLPYLAAALEAKPEQLQYWLSYIDALIQSDETDTAKQVLELGREHGLQGDDMEALAVRLEGSAQIAAAPQSVAAPQSKALQSDKKRSKLKASQPANSTGKTQPRPQQIDTLLALYSEGRFAEAETLARSLTSRFPRHGLSWKMLGVVIREQGRPAEALLPMQTAAELLPQDVAAQGNLGITLKALGRLAEAEASYRRALQIQPTYAEIHNNLGNVLKDLGRLPEAEASYRRALELKPAYAEAHNNLGSLLQARGRLTDAEASFLRALELTPDDPVSRSGMLFGLSHNEAVDAAALFAEHCRFGVQFEAPLRAQWPQHGNSREPKRCLQVGFVSGDLRGHAVATFIEPVWAHLAAFASLSLHAYANHTTDDSTTQRLRGYVQHWHPVAGLSDTALAEKIRADGIDILIDLSGHTAHHRLLSFARKPAPVQISWIGYPGTTGLSSMDYYLSDRFFLPPGQFDHQYTEKLVYLPATAPFLPSAEAPPVNDLPALNNGYLTFGSFNRPNKISRAVIALWSQLLRALPDARMLLGAMPQDGQYDTLIAWFAGEGIARERLDFHPRSNMQAYLALHHQVDVCLDAFPYNGSTTSLHALWMGVPTLTLAGSTIAGRAGAWVLGHVGLDALVAPDAAAFVQQGLSLATDNFSTLANLRSGLRERFAQSALGQPEVIAAGLERALRTMWQRWCAGLPAESFEACVPTMEQHVNVIQENDQAQAKTSRLLDQQQIDTLGVLYGQGRFAEVETLACSLTVRFPRYGFSWKILGAVLQQQGRVDEALLPMQKAAELLPQDAEAHSNLGAALKSQGRLTEAEASHRRALALNPASVEAHNNLGVTLKSQGRLTEAEASYRRALDLNPAYIQAHSNLGNVFKEQGRLSEAEASYRQALELTPTYVEGHNNLGVLLQQQGRLTEAELIYRRALELNPDYVDGYNNLGSLLNGQGRLTEAETCLRRALELKPDDAASHSALLFGMSQNEAVDAAALFAEHCRFAAQFEAPLRAQWPQHGNSREPERCLQVGFVSGDLRNHAVASFIEPVLAQLSAYAGLSLHAYANHRTDDNVTQRLRGYVKHWHPVAGLSDAALAEKISADGIDILFDLSNHTSLNRLLSFARKPAPVQISWIGYHGTTGLSSMDYYLTDRFFLPPGQFDHQFTEKLVYLPAWAPFLPSAEAPPVNDLPALNNGYLTFGSFNRPSKISRPVIALWSQLLRAVPDSRMVLGAMREDGQYDTLIAWFSAEGVARERLDFHPHSNMQDYLALHHQVDVCLDTFPYNGGTTTLHALWMGVPTLTLAGSTVAGRTGAGILGHVALDALVAQDAAAFVQQGLSLAADFSSLAKLRSGLRERFAQSAPGQPALIAASLERALRTMWQRWCAGLPTESFEITLADMTIPTPPQQATDPAMAPCNALTQPVAAVAAAAPLASKSIAIVSATKLSENDFWSNSALGLSLKRHLKEDARLSVKIAFENARGLPEIFNNAIDQAEDDAILVFIHDDVWVDEANFSDAVIAGLENFDAIGVAGNRRRVPNQPAWAFIDDQFTWDDKSNLSGRIAHGKDAFGPVSDFGAAPAECELLDGVFLATKKSSLIQNNVRFDAQFDFHFYDMDFCRSARRAGLRLGTWLVNLTHQSDGAFGSPHWKENYQRYLSKWETASENNDVTFSPHEITDKEQELQQAINDVLQTALKHQTAGQLEQAEHIYVEILKIQPKHAAANHALGLMEINLNGALAALPRLEIAVMEKPEIEQYWVSYIGALMQSGPADSVADALELGLKYGLSSETAQKLTADFVKELESQASRNILANEKHGAINQTPVHEHHNPDLLRVIPECSEFVIEIGCSSGALAREFKKIKPDCSYFGVDIDSQYTLLADRYCDRTAAIDIEESGNDFFIEHQHRDCWVFGDTLEHFRDPWKILRKVRSVIPAQGCVVACIPNAQHWSVQVKLGVGDFRYQDSGLLDRTHLRWFTRQTIMELFAETGFDVIECSPRIFNEPAREKFLPLIGNMAQSAGFDSAMAINDALPLQYVIKAIPR